jgi:hypothetical protein
LHTNCCKQVQEDEEIQNDIDLKHQAEAEVAPLGSATAQTREKIPIHSNRL